MLAAACYVARLEYPLHALGLDHRNGRRPSQEFDQLPGGVSFLDELPDFVDRLAHGGTAILRQR
jgi:hypothetical protein